MGIHRKYTAKINKAEIMTGNSIFEVGVIDMNSKFCPLWWH